jgi:hypothetical protein
MIACIGAAVWACGSSTPTGYGDNTNGNGSNSSNNNGSNNNSSSHSNSGYGSNTGNNNGSSTTGNNNNSTTNNNNGSTSTGNNNPGTSSTASQGTGMACGMPAIACSAAVTSGAVATANCFYTGTKGGGSNFYFADGMGSTACVDANALCSKGTTAAQGSPPNYSIYGAGFGFQVNQTSNYGDAGSPTLGASLSWAVSGTPPPSFRIGISAFSGPCSGSSGCCYQTAAGAMSGTIMWNQFVTDCWDGASADGGTFSTSDGLFEIKFQANAGSAATSYDYCVTSISY